MNKRQRIAQVVLNIIIIAELCMSIFLASKEPELFTIVFFKYFFMMLIPTVILGVLTIKMLRTKEQQLEIPAHTAEQHTRTKAKASAPVIRQKKPASTSREIPKILTRGHNELVRISKWKSPCFTVEIGLSAMIRSRMRSRATGIASFPSPRSL